MPRISDSATTATLPTALRALEDDDDELLLVIVLAPVRVLSSVSEDCFEASRVLDCGEKRTGDVLLRKLGKSSAENIELDVEYCCLFEAWAA